MPKPATDKSNPATDVEGRSKALLAALPKLLLGKRQGLVQGRVLKLLAEKGLPYKQRVALCRALYLFGFDREALEMTGLAVKRHPNSVELLILQHDLQTLLDTNNTAIDRLEALARQTGRKRAMVARRLHQSGKADVALSLLTAADGAELDWSEKLSLHDILRAMRQVAGAETVLADLVQHGADRADVQKAVLRAAFGEAGPEAGLAAFAQLAQPSDPARSEVLTQLLALGAMRSAEQFFEANFSDAPPTSEDACRLYLALGRAAEVEKGFVAAILEQPLHRWNAAQFAIAVRAAFETGDLELAATRVETGRILFPHAGNLAHLKGQILFRSGRWGEGVAYFAALVAACPGDREIALLRQRYLMQIGRYGSVEQASQGIDAKSRNRQRLLLMRLASVSGRPAELRRLATALEEPDFTGSLARLSALADVCLTEGDLNGALEYSGQALRLHPEDKSLWLQAGKLRFLAGDIEGAQDARTNGRNCASLDEDGSARDDTPELVLPMAAGAADARRVFSKIAGHNFNDQVTLLLDAGVPDTICATSWMQFLFRWLHSARAQFVAGDTAQIPPRLMTYWEGPHAEPVELVRAAWERLLPEFEHHSHDQKSAWNWMQKNTDPELRQIFSRCDTPAMRADIFRLAWQEAEGGVYVDIDEWPRSDIRDWLCDATLVLCHEKGHSTIGNHFIASKPHHPALTEALAALRARPPQHGGLNTWMETGPGLMTRTVGAWIANATRATGLIPGFRLLQQNEYGRCVSTNLMLPHKFLSSHWRA